MPIILIDALDTLFFRDGKPFSMGDDVWASGMFPPSPSVFYGALRSAFFSEKINEFQHANKENDPTKNLVIHGISYAIEDKPYYPFAMDMVKEKNEIEEKKNKSILLKKTETQNFISNSIFNSTLKPIPNERIESISSGIFNLGGLSEYLISETASTYSNLNDYLTFEPKIGIARDKITKTSEDGKLYRVNMARTENKDKQKLKFFVEYSGLEIEKEGFLKLGAEGKTAYYQRVENTTLVPELNLDEFDRFKLYLLTPCFFKNGSLPSWISSDTLEGEYKGVKLKLENAIIGKYISIGGFDMIEKKPKLMRRGVPQGSVYYFKLLSTNKEKLKEVFHYQSISEFNQKEGFGITFLGKCT
jgi:CRISPR-associated protein Cmr3